MLRFIVILTLLAGGGYAQGSLRDDCLRISGQGSARARSPISVFNGCPRRKHVAVCLIDRFGEADLHVSSRSVPSGGRMTVTPRSNYRIEEVYVTGGDDAAPLPIPCRLPPE